MMKLLTFHPTKYKRFGRKLPSIREKAKIASRLEKSNFLKFFFKRYKISTDNNANSPVNEF